MSRRTWNFNLQVELLRVHALGRLRAAIEGFGDNIGEIRHRALDQLMTALAEQALGIDRGRYAYALPCGGGKTQGAVALIAAAHDLGLGLTFAVAANTIRALCLIKRDLIAAGVPERAIGLRHSKSAETLRKELADEAGLTTEAMRDTGDEDRPIMLVSHSHIRGSKGALFAAHKGLPRSLMVWDETLLTADASFMSLRGIRDSVRCLEGHMAADSQLLRFLHAAEDRIVADAGAQELGGTPMTLYLSDGFDLGAVRKEASALPANGNNVLGSSVSFAIDLTLLAERPLAVALTGNGSGDQVVIHYTIKVDMGWRNIAVLDASHSVRLLAQAGDIVDRTTDDMRNCRTYEQVVVRQAKVAASKGTQEGKGRAAKAAAHQAAEIVGGILPCEYILIFVFKSAKKSFLAVLRGAGVDLDAKIDGKRRISVLTWGQETSTNAYSHCQNVILAGVMRQDRERIAASLAGEANDLLHRRSNAGLAEVLRSEMAHCLLQGMHRGACRKTDTKGRAQEMMLYIIDRETGLRELLMASLPGVRWKDAETPGESPRIATQQATAKVRAYLQALPDTTKNISTKALKRAVNADIGRVAWASVINAVVTPPSLKGLDGADTGWIKEGRSLARSAG